MGGQKVIITEDTIERVRGLGPGSCGQQLFQEICDLAKMGLEARQAYWERKLAEFALRVLQAHRGTDIGDVDGGFLQDLAENLGLLVRTRVDKPCDEHGNCFCAIYGDFPQDCLRLSEDVLKKMKTLGSE